MKVWPKNEDMRKILRHPSGNVPFPENGPLDWPEDSFTTRRLADGDVLAEEPASPESASPEPTTSSSGRHKSKE